MRTTDRIAIARHAYVVALIASPTLLAPRAAVAQQPLTPVQVEATMAARSNVRADALEAKAGALYGTRREWRTVADLHRRAAALRGTDPRAVMSYRQAAWAYSAAHDNGMARQMMERAAETAAAGGDVERAANAYIDAAFLAVEDDRGDRLPGLLRSVRALLGAPLLPEERRAAIVRRIEGAPRLAQAWGAQ